MLDYFTLARLFAQARRPGDVADAPCPACGPRCRHHGNAPKLRIWRCRGGDAYGYNCARCGLKGGAGASGRAPSRFRRATKTQSTSRFTHASKPQSAADPAANTAFALALWRRTRPAPGTPVEAYLQSRGITLPVPNRIRFHPHLRHPSDSRWPGMVAGITDAADRPVGVHRTFLARDGRGKAPVEPARLSLGPTSGSAVRLAPATAEILVGEGIETCLTAMQATGRPAWAALSAGGLRALVLPPVVRSIVILADNDDGGEGKDAAQEAAQRWLQEGRRVRVALPPAGCDFNDLLRGAR
jgi:putative DNA primase/helicase